MEFFCVVHGGFSCLVLRTWDRVLDPIWFKSRGFSMPHTIRDGYCAMENWVVFVSSTEAFSCLVPHTSDHVIGSNFMERV